MHSGGYIGLGFRGMNAMSMLGAMMGSFSYQGNAGWLSDAADVCYNAGNRSLIYDGYSGMHAGRFGSVGQCMANITALAKSVDNMWPQKRAGGPRGGRKADGPQTPAQQTQQPQQAGKKDPANKAKGSGGTDETDDKKKLTPEQRARQDQQAKARGRLGKLGYGKDEIDRIFTGIEASLARDDKEKNVAEINSRYKTVVEGWVQKRLVKKWRDRKGKEHQKEMPNKKWALQSGISWLVNVHGITESKAREIVRKAAIKRKPTGKKPLNFMHLKQKDPQKIGRRDFIIYKFVSGVGDAKDQYDGVTLGRRGKYWYRIENGKPKYITGSWKITDDSKRDRIEVNLNGKKDWSEEPTVSYNAEKLIKLIEKAAGVDSSDKEGAVAGPIRTMGPCSVRAYETDARKKEVKVTYDALKARAEKYIDKRKKEFDAKKNGAGKIRLVLLFKKGMEPEVDKDDKDDNPFKKLAEHLEKKYGVKFDIVKRAMDTVHYTTAQRGEIRDLVFMKLWNGGADVDAMNDALGEANKQIESYHETTKGRLPYPFKDALRKCKEKFLAHAREMHKKWKAKEITLNQYKAWFEGNGTKIGTWEVPGARKIFDKYFKDKIAQFEWKKPAPKPKKKPSGGGGGGGGGGGTPIS